MSYLPTQPSVSTLSIPIASILWNEKYYDYMDRERNNNTSNTTNDDDHTIYNDNTTTSITNMKSTQKMNDPQTNEFYSTHEIKLVDLNSLEKNTNEFENDNFEDTQNHDHPRTRKELPETRLPKSASFMTPISDTNQLNSSSNRSPIVRVRTRASSVSEESSLPSATTTPRYSSSSASVPSSITRLNTRTHHPLLVSPLFCPRTPWTSPASSPFESPNHSPLPWGMISPYSTSHSSMVNMPNNIMSSEATNTTTATTTTTTPTNSTPSSSNSSNTLAPTNLPAGFSAVSGASSFLSPMTTNSNISLVSPTSVRAVIPPPHPRTPFSSPAVSHSFSPLSVHSLSAEGLSISRPVSPFSLPSGMPNNSLTVSNSSFITRGTLSISSILAAPSASPTLYPMTPQSSPQPMSPLLCDSTNSSPSSSPARVSRTFLASSRSRTSSPFQVFNAAHTQVQY